MNRRSSERGQVLPLWIFGAVTTLALMFLAINYANAVRYQIRAQNAADSAAEALVAIQAQKYNLMNIMLYSSNVEEYRLRKSLDGILLSINATGGCRLVPTVILGQIYIANDTDPQGCDYAYIGERGEYLKAVNRYTSDLNLLNDITATNTFTQWQNDANLMLASLNSTSNCGSASAANVTGDCKLKYHLLSKANVNNEELRANLEAVQEDAAKVLIPGVGTTSSLPNDGENKNYFDPVQVDVTTCVIVPPIIPNFGPIHLQPTYAIGRAAAANVMIEEDWMQPGAIVDPARSGSQVFQAPESYANSSGYDATGSTGSGQYDWYGINFGGNTTQAYAQYAAFNAPLATDEMSARVGWWNAIPIHPFAATATTPAGACT